MLRVWLDMLDLSGFRIRHFEEGCKRSSKYAAVNLRDSVGQDLNLANV